MDNEALKAVPKRVIEVVSAVPERVNEFLVERTYQIILESGDNIEALNKKENLLDVDDERTCISKRASTRANLDAYNEEALDCIRYWKNKEDVVYDSNTCFLDLERSFNPTTCVMDVKSPPHV